MLSGFALLFDTGSSSCAGRFLGESLSSVKSITLSGLDWLLLCVCVYWVVCTDESFSGLKNFDTNGSFDCVFLDLLAPPLLCVSDCSITDVEDALNDELNEES